jgi:thymidylate synthase
MTSRYSNFREAIVSLEDQLLKEGVPVHSNFWQAMDVRNNKEAQMLELPFVSFVVRVPSSVRILEADTKPNQPWADEHFDERVGGEPLNPPPSWVRWPWANAADKHRTEEGGKFSHTYPERYWPKHAEGNRIMLGVRYAYGDLDSVIQLLVKDPLTRQAYFPIFFPEDTGAEEGQRIPCSIGYHFFFRDGLLHCVYQLRSCDLFRHFRDDLYLTARLVQHVCDKLVFDHGWRVKPGDLYTHITSLHIFQGDKYALEKQIRKERV